MGMDKQKLLGKRNLTDFEKRWLADRNIEHPEVGTDVADVPTPDSLDDSAGNAAALDTSGQAEQGGAGQDDEVLPYDQWLWDDLKAECEARKLAKSGTKAELVARLEQDDAAQG